MTARWARIGTVAVALGSAATLGACSASTSNSTTAGAQATQGGASASASGVPASAELPDQVPMPRQATLAAPVAQIASSGNATGWTAVAITPIGTNSTATAAALRNALDNGGWTTKLVGSADNAIGIAARAPATNPVRWLNISVTKPLPDSGPAVTYRYVSLPTPLSLPSPSTSATRRAQ